METNKAETKKPESMWWLIPIGLFWLVVTALFSMAKETVMLSFGSVAVGGVLFFICLVRLLCKQK